ncbi:MAG: MBL fold metallo-hydrolase [Deltaproteobacteria bacterium]|nr:MBL fold metallo-hydrolase [Deltaproteobacteria bacterium]
MHPRSSKRTSLIPRFFPFLQTRFLVCVLIALILSSCGNSYYQGPRSDHFDGNRFSNPWDPMPNRFLDFLKWRFTADRGPWPESIEVKPTKPPERVTGSELRVTYIGHATVLLQTAGMNILTDPIWSDRASPFSFAGPKRVTAAGVKFEDLPPIDLVLVSHNHYDHLDMRTLQRLYEASDPLVVTALGNDTIIHREIPKMNVRALDWGQDLTVSEAITVSLAPMQHWSARGLFDRNEALWAAFVIEAPGGPIYFLADAGYEKSLSLDVVSKHGTPRLSLLPVGAYEPLWFMQYAHITPEQAVQTFLDLGQGYAMGTQHEVFPLADEGYAEPREDLNHALVSKGLSRAHFRLPKVAEWFMVPKRDP